MTTPRRTILTINAGSSSIKAALFDADGDLQQPLLTDQITGIGAAVNSDAATTTHDQALHRLLTKLGDTHVVAIGHRIVHGGTGFAAPALIDDEVLQAIEALEPLAPLHQPHNLAGVRAAQTTLPGVPQVACFDTAFHRSMPELQQRFALPQALHDAGIRRYGFHGLSYESIAAQLREIDPKRAGGRVVVAHLGNGASMCAMLEGRSVATTMSFSPLDGLTMGTRCGRIDAAVVLHLLLREGWSAERIERLLHRESGLLGLSGTTSDMRELLASDAPEAALAVDHFVESALRELAFMAAALRGIDRLVFTGGIGENAAVLRERIAAGAAWMGPFTTQVLHTQEERVIAGHVARAAVAST